MKCKNCGAVIPNNSKNCPNCYSEMLITDNNYNNDIINKKLITNVEKKSFFNRFFHRWFKFLVAGAIVYIIFIILFFWVWKYSSSTGNIIGNGTFSTDVDMNLKIDDVQVNNIPIIQATTDKEFTNGHSETYDKRGKRTYYLYYDNLEDEDWNIYYSYLLEHNFSMGKSVNSAVSSCNNNYHVEISFQNTTFKQEIISGFKKYSVQYHKVIVYDIKSC